MQFIGADSKKEQLSRLWNKLLIPSCDGYEILFNEGDLLKVSKNGNVISVTYANDSQLYRSLLLAAELIADGEDREIEEKEQFERKGVMLDMSRAGVMTVDAVKEYIEYMALYDGSLALDALTQLTMLPLDRKHYRPKELNSMIKKFLQ